MEALSSEKTVLTAALTAAQLQLKEATPAGFAAEAGELRRQAEAARHEASAARAEAAAAAGKAAEAQRREAEVRQGAALWCRLVACAVLVAHCGHGSTGPMPTPSH